MPISGKALIKELISMGWSIKSQKGSHVKLEKSGKIIIVPLHRELSKGTEYAIRKQAKD